MRRLILIGLLVSASCSREDDVASGRQNLEAFCTAQVVGVGEVDVETDYLPKVVSCENGGASFEALKVQAVTARSYLYYRLARTGDINDGTNDQVYSCNRPPRMEHFMAVAATAGQVLQYQGTRVASFYVAGAKQLAPTCRGGTDDPTNTEKWVTYNEGQSGADIEQTSLGLVNPSNLANRGCASQNGADCLSDEGWDYQRIMRFYYGDDIELVQSEGACITPPNEPDAGVADARVADSSDAGAGSGADDTDVSGGCMATGGAGGGAMMLLLLGCFLALRPRSRD